jgi:hypothetical protein
MIVATKTSLAGYEVPGTFEAVRAEALFVSALQPSGSPSPDQIRRAVAVALQRLGVRGCAAQVAGEFGDHPDTAVARMSWALGTINTAYPAPSIPTRTRLPGRARRSRPRSRALLEQVASLDEVQVSAWALADILKVLSALTFQGR